MILNHIHANNAIVNIYLNNFVATYEWMNPQVTEEFTSFIVTMSRFPEGKPTECVDFEVYHEYVRSSKAEEVFRIYNEAWDAFLKACAFCEVSPVSDGSTVDIYLGTAKTA